MVSEKMMILKLNLSWHYKFGRMLFIVKYHVTGIYKLNLWVGIKKVTIILMTYGHLIWSFPTTVLNLQP
jgi:hypothetical protein